MSTFFGVAVAINLQSVKKEAVEFQQLPFFDLLKVDKNPVPLSIFGGFLWIMATKHWMMTFAGQNRVLSLQSLCDRFAFSERRL